ncbi:MAG: cohesin domain-containing protein [Methanosarcinales archaeon]
MVRVRRLTYLIVASVLLSLFAMGVSAEDEVYLEPQNSTVRVGETVDVEIWVNATGFQGGQINLTYNSSCVNITDWVNNSADFELGYWNSMTDGREWILFAANYSETEIPLTGAYKIGTLTIEGVSQGSTELKFSENSSIFDDYGNEITTVKWINGEIQVGLPKDGNIDGANGVNMDDAVYLVKYLYHVPGYDELHADGNIDSANGVNMDDAVYLVKYLYHVPGYDELYP